jgi:hypothetical protein
MTHIITGLFDNRGDAERTVEHLVQELGLDPRGVEVHATEGDDAARREAGHGSFRARAGGQLPHMDRHAYEEGIRRGGIVVAAAVDETRLERAMDAFEACGAVDLDEREAGWRRAGWGGDLGQTGYTGHDEDIGFATFGGDAVIGHIPKHHHDDAPAGALGRLELASARRELRRARVRGYVRKAPSQGG